MKAERLFNVEGKIALITGSTGGLGSLFAKGLAENGCKVILNSRSQAKVDAQVKEFEEKGYQACGYAFDITNGKEINQKISQIKEEVGIIDILVNNAGINLRAPLEDFDDADWDKVIGINLTGAYKVSKAVAKGMIEKKAGKIINIGSLQSELGRPTIAPYAASKGGLKMLTKGMAADWAKYNIQINGIGPGYFKTEMTKPLYENPEFDSWLCGRTPSMRWGNTEELLGALLFLSSPASSYVNGQMLYVDGGMLATV
ncbi:MAG TPA: SDR family NAD(P)-dependent oxidoreductase [Draconibacterium sp.]|nr:SDR family NAD(P)-dependent oxidoreductase [Draconibacterium sp.]